MSNRRRYSERLDEDRLAQAAQMLQAIQVFDGMDQQRQSNRLRTEQFEYQKEQDERDSDFRERDLGFQQDRFLHEQEMAIARNAIAQETMAFEQAREKRIAAQEYLSNWTSAEAEKQKAAAAMALRDFDPRRPDALNTLNAIKANSFRLSAQEQSELFGAQEVATLQFVMGSTWRPEQERLYRRAVSDGLDPRDAFYAVEESRLAESELNNAIKWANEEGLAVPPVPYDTLRTVVQPRTDDPQRPASPFDVASPATLYNPSKVRDYLTTVWQPQIQSQLKGKEDAKAQEDALNREAKRADIESTQATTAKTRAQAVLEQDKADMVLKERGEQGNGAPWAPTPPPSVKVGKSPASQFGP